MKNRIICADCGLDLTYVDLSGCNSCPQCFSQKTKEIEKDEKLVN